MVDYNLTTSAKTVVEAINENRKKLPVFINGDLAQSNVTISANTSTTEYVYIIDTPTGTTEVTNQITAEEGLIWQDGVDLTQATLLPAHKYVVSVIANLACWGEFGDATVTNPQA